MITLSTWIKRLFTKQNKYIYSVYYYTFGCTPVAMNEKSISTLFFFLLISWLCTLITTTFPIVFGSSQTSRNEHAMEKTGSASRKSTKESGQEQIDWLCPTPISLRPEKLFIFFFLYKLSPFSLIFSPMLFHLFPSTEGSTYLLCFDPNFLFFAHKIV